MLPQPHTISSLLTDAVQQLADTSPSPRLDAELLLCHALGCTRLKLIIDPHELINQEAVLLFQRLVTRRKQYEPVAYLTGTKEFWGLPFEVSPAVLIPRPDTEILVEETLRLLSDLQLRKKDSPSTPFRLLDLGTGSGCIIVALLHEAQQRCIPATGVAIDQSYSSLLIAERNARRHLVNPTFVQASWVSALAPNAFFDLIVSNPPYIDPTDTNRSPETNHEPSHALFAPEQGLADIYEILATCPPLLNPGGSILLEVGKGQAHLIAQHCAPRGWSVRIAHDLSGTERVVIVTPQRDPIGR